MNKNFIFCFLFFFLIGCSENKIDTSSEEAMKKSVEKVRNSLPEDKRTSFNNALALIGFSQIDMAAVFAGRESGDDTLIKMKAVIKGKTGNEVIEEAEKIKAERKQKEKALAKERKEKEISLDIAKNEKKRSEAFKEILELEGRRIEAENAKEQLSKVKVIRSRFYMEGKKYGKDEPVIEITVMNGTPHEISRIYFTGTLASLNRETPWNKDDFNYSIRGGLQPGESQSLNLSPNMFSSWGKVDAPPDAIFNVTVDKIDGPDGKELLSTEGFRQKDVERLESLKQEYGQ